MRKAFLPLSVLCVACLWGGQPASAQAPQYYQQQPQYQPQYQQQYRQGAPAGQVPGTAYPGTAPYEPPRVQVDPGGVATSPRSRWGSALTVGECSNLGCSVREDSSCPAIVHDYHTRHWACQCGGGSSCVNQSSPY